jgi:hypothetical protein
MLQTDRLAAIGAQLRTDRIEGTAHVAESFARAQGIDLDARIAILTGRPQKSQAFKVAALALPVADLIFDEIQHCRLAKIRNRKDGFEYRLQTGAFALLPAADPFAETGCMIRAEFRSDSESAPQF